MAESARAAARGALPALDQATAALVRLAAVIAAGDWRSVRDAFVDARAAGASDRWIEELVLQSYLFSGFPRTLNAAREWRLLVPEPAAPDEDPSDHDADHWRRLGEATCAAVYGEMYDKLRHNVDRLHPVLDRWMIVEGYGKVLSRPGLDLPRRELCIVASCVATRQDRQLHSHLHGALNVGVSAAALGDALVALAPVVGAEALESARLLLARVVGK